MRLPTAVGRDRSRGSLTTVALPLSVQGIAPDATVTALAVTPDVAASAKWRGHHEAAARPRSARSSVDLPLSMLTGAQAN